MGRKWTDISLCPYFVVEKLIDFGVVVKCLGYVKYTKFVNGENFSNFVETCYGNLNPSSAKNVVNCFLDYLIKK